MERRTGARANVNEAKKREQPRAESRVNSETGEGGWASGGGGGNKGPLGPACGRGANGVRAAKEPVSGA